MRWRTVGRGWLWAALLHGCQCAEATPVKSRTEPAPELSSGVTLAQRVCAVLQTEPAQRRAACCGGGADRHLADECALALGGALQRQSLSIDVEALEECARASAEQQRGCDW